MIEVQGLRKSFNDVEVLRGARVTARDGKIHRLIGPNGTGKTTTMRMLYTVLRPDSGRALVDGYDASLDRLEEQRRIGVLPDDPGLYPLLTAREHVRYFCRLHCLREPESETGIEHLMDRPGMMVFVDRRPKGFSKG